MHEGRLVTIDGFSLVADEEMGFPVLQGKFAVTTYLAPPGQGVTAGATPAAPAPSTAPPTTTTTTDAMKDLLEKLKSARSSGGEVKMPPFFKDLYSDLRDRHLLPLVVVLLVAIVAAPILLKASDPDLSPTQAETSLPEAVPASARLEVVADVPALRDYRDRLSDLVAKDPFKQHFSEPQVEGAQLGPDNRDHDDGADHRAHGSDRACALARLHGPGASSAGLPSASGPRTCPGPCPCSGPHACPAEQWRIGR